MGRPPTSGPRPGHRTGRAGAGRQRLRADRELIELGLERGRNAMAIWQDLVDDHGFPAGYASVRRYVAKQTPSEKR